MICVFFKCKFILLINLNFYFMSQNNDGLNFHFSYNELINLSFEKEALLTRDITDLTPSQKSVITDGGTITASKVIIATNAYTGTKERFGEFLRRRLVPAQSCIIVTEVLGHEKVQALMPKHRMYGNTANLFSYFRPTPDRDRILLGSRSMDKVTRHQSQSQGALWVGVISMG